MTNKRNKVSVSIISGVTVGLLLLTMGKGSASMVLTSQKDIDMGRSTITQRVKKRVWGSCREFCRTGKLKLSINCKQGGGEMILLSFFCNKKQTYKA